jgi:hypothetical protein
VPSDRPGDGNDQLRSALADSRFQTWVSQV